jgi:flavin-dependent dehydrogenase
MPLVGGIAREARPCGPIAARACGSQRLDVAAGADWIAAGDAASRFDPLSSQGITKALRSGVFASYAVADLLTRGDSRGIRRYQRFIRSEFDSYLRTRAQVYAQEQRWPQSEFWSSRGEHNPQQERGHHA